MIKHDMLDFGQLDDVLVAKPMLIKLDEAEILRGERFVNHLGSLMFLISVSHCSTTYLNSVYDGAGLVRKRRNELGEFCVRGE
jgi:hypothetical protein